MRKKIEVGYIDIPKNYIKMKDAQKKQVCNIIIDKLYAYLDGELDPVLNRIDFLNDVFDSTLESNVEMEYYEVAATIRDCKKILNES